MARRITWAQETFAAMMAAHCPGHTQTVLALYSEDTRGASVHVLEKSAKEARIWLQRNGYLITDEGKSAHGWYFRVENR